MPNSLIVGLGNPGENYAKTRHNVGFMVIDEILKDYTFERISNKKFQGELFKTAEFFALKPSTFMNLSGLSVLSVKNFYKIDRIIVIHDDLDLKLGRLKFKIGGSSGGHNGIKSIDSAIGVKYERVRVGIANENKNDAATFVLGNFAQNEQFCLKKVIVGTKDATLMLLNSDISSVSQKFGSKFGLCLNELSGTEKSSSLKMANE